MDPKKVCPRNFKVESVIYDDGEFSIVLGKYLDNEQFKLAMRWNGDGDDPGYPKTFGNPMWFIITDNLKGVILKSIFGLKDSYNKNILDSFKKIY